MRLAGLRLRVAPGRILIGPQAGSWTRATGHLIRPDLAILQVHRHKSQRGVNTHKHSHSNKSARTHKHTTHSCKHNHTPRQGTRGLTTHTLDPCQVTEANMKKTCQAFPPCRLQPSMENSCPTARVTAGGKRLAYSPLMWTARNL